MTDKERIAELTAQVVKNIEAMKATREQLNKTIEESNILLYSIKTMTSKSLYSEMKSGKTLLQAIDDAINGGYNLYVHTPVHTPSETIYMIDLTDIQRVEYGVNPAGNQKRKQERKYPYHDGSGSIVTAPPSIKNNTNFDGLWSGEMLKEITDNLK